MKAMISQPMSGKTEKEETVIETTEDELTAEAWDELTDGKGGYE